MSSQIVCDACGEPIDVTQPFYTGSGQKVQVAPDGTRNAVEEVAQFDFHVEHVPWTPDGEPAEPQTAERDLLGSSLDQPGTPA